MTAFRERRLTEEARRLHELCRACNVLEVRELEGAPAARYALRYKLAPLAIDASGRITRPGASMTVLLTLPPLYPLERPLAMVAPGDGWRPFYPNVAPQQPHHICLGVAHSPAIWVTEIASRIWDVLRLANYRLDNVLDPHAAQYVRKLITEGRLPLCQGSIFEARDEVFP